MRLLLRFVLWHIGSLGCLECQPLSTNHVKLPFISPNIANQHGVLQNVKMIKVPTDYIVTESKRCNVALRQGNECIFLPLPCKSDLVLISLTVGN